MKTRKLKKRARTRRKTKNPGYKRSPERSHERSPIFPIMSQSPEISPERRSPIFPIMSQSPELSPDFLDLTTESPDFLDLTTESPDFLDLTTDPPDLDLTTPNVLDYQSNFVDSRMLKLLDTERSLSDIELLNQVKFDPMIPPQTLAIGIFTHGSIIGELCDIDGCTAKKNKNYPEGVSVRVKHDGPYGSVCGYHFNKKKALTDTKKALTHLDECIDRATFSERVSVFESTDKPLISLDNACELVEGTTEFAEKEFVADSHYPQMYLMIQLPGEKERCVSLIDCDDKTLYDFFKTRQLDGYDNDTNLSRFQLHKLIARFIRHRNTSMCTTTLFFLISIAHKFLNVITANILDKSCNSVLPHKDYKGETYKGYMVANSVKRPKGIGSKDIGYGGYL